tara:strand:- start:1027 stop:1194 length:168 start_codon:yes stop_codon:yes gene_type:complete
MNNLVQAVKGQSSKEIFLALGMTVAVLTGIYYYHSIKVQRLNIAKLEKELGITSG